MDRHGGCQRRLVGTRGDPALGGGERGGRGGGVAQERERGDLGPGDERLVARGADRIDRSGRLQEQRAGLDRLIELEVRAGQIIQRAALAMAVAQIAELRHRVDVVRDRAGEVAERLLEDAEPRRRGGDLRAMAQLDGDGARALEPAPRADQVAREQRDHAGLVGHRTVAVAVTELLVGRGGARDRGGRGAQLALAAQRMPEPRVGVGDHDLSGGVGGPLVELVQRALVRRAGGDRVPRDLDQLTAGERHPRAQHRIGERGGGGLDRGEVVLDPRQIGLLAPAQRPRQADPRVGVLVAELRGRVHRRVEQAPPQRQAALHRQQRIQRERQRDHLLARARIGLRRRVGVGRQELVGIARQLGARIGGAGADQPGSQRRGALREVRGVAIGQLGLASRIVVERGHRDLAQRLQPSQAPGVAIEAHERVRAQALEHREHLAPRRGQHGLRGRHREAGREHRAVDEARAGLGVAQLERIGHGAADRAVPAVVAGAHQQLERSFESTQDLRRRQHLHPRGGEFDRQRQPAEAAHDLGDHRQLVGQRQRRAQRPGALEEQRDRVGDRRVGRHLQRDQRPALLAGELERHPRGRDHLGVGRPRQPRADHRDRAGLEVLAVVEREQDARASRERRPEPRHRGVDIAAGIDRIAEHARDPPAQRRGGAGAGKIDPPHAAAAVRRVRLAALGGQPRRDPGLAHAAGPEDRDQPRAGVEERGERRQLAVATDQRRQAVDDVGSERLPSHRATLPRRWSGRGHAVASRQR